MSGPSDFSPAPAPAAVPLAHIRHSAARLAAAGLLACAGLGAASLAQAQAYLVPALSAGGTGLGAQAVFTYPGSPGLTATFLTSGTTTGGIYSYGIRSSTGSVSSFGGPVLGNFVHPTVPPGAAVPLATPAVQMDVWGYGCATPGTSVAAGVVCANRGTLTITFSQAVTDPVIHLGGLGTNETDGADTLRYNAQYTLTAVNGAAPAAGVLSQVGSNGRFVVTGNAAQSNAPAATQTASCGGNGAACGSAKVTGVVTSLTFSVSLRGYGTDHQGIVGGSPAGVPAGAGWAQSQNNGYADGHTVSATVIPRADLRVTKTNNQTVYTPGQSVTYVIQVTNAGPNGVSGASLVDSLPASLTGATWTATYAGTDASGPASGTGSINTTVIALPPSGTATFTVTATVDAATTGNLVNTATVALPAGMVDPTPGNNTATDTDTPVSRVTLVKTSLGGVGSFAFTGTNGLAAQTITTVTAGTPVSAPIQTLTTPGAVTVVTETIPAGYALTAASCTGLGAGTATPNLAAGTLTLDAAATAAGANIVCTFTNTRQPVLRLQKRLPAGRLITTDQFLLTIANSGGSATATTVGATTAPVAVATLSAATVGSSYTLSEAGAGGAALGDYTSTYSCTNALAGGATPSGNATSFTYTPVAGDDLLCTFFNASVPRADLAVAKTASPATVQAGGVTTYTLTATNNGPSAANGAVLRDAPGPGLDCSTPATATCVGTAGATCPAAAVSVASLTGSTGIVIPLLPVGGVVTVTLQCRVTASGMP